MNHLDNLHPVFRRKVEAIIRDVNGLLRRETGDSEASLVVVSGYRSPEYQARLYSVGRARPESPYKIRGLTVMSPSKKEYPKWSIVTKAAPFDSAHQYGLAVDFAFKVNGKIRWDAPDKWWQWVYSSAKAHECEDITKSVPWDKGHIQYGKLWGIVKKDRPRFIRYWHEGGLKRVWAELPEV